ncbi:uncharacterized protein EDB91DRAFT_1269995 [Suillus paluster]|uniref:uncharacterized protein n=1 Tax=Suillus paluster TaxID=48578 RepID=UPI001B86A204|nr:uncharacterized protein EDB91DRAFT_1269995 [Suillus paluster]KAG1745459.1 hypothetical protein EDB91DRAFT_1269995 [Suillus paluster]
MKLELPKYEMYNDAIQAGLNKLSKYYKKFDDKPVYVLALVLHPYYKLTYIKMQWGGPEEQVKECAAGNLNAIDWYDECYSNMSVTCHFILRTRLDLDHGYDSILVSFFLIPLF